MEESERKNKTDDEGSHSHFPKVYWMDGPWRSWSPLRVGYISDDPSLS